jgi:hypothetical protein
LRSDVPSKSVNLATISKENAKLVKTHSSMKSVMIETESASEVVCLLIHVTRSRY